MAMAQSIQITRNMYTNDTIKCETAPTATASASSKKALRVAQSIQLLLPWPNVYLSTSGFSLGSSRHRHALGVVADDDLVPARVDPPVVPGHEELSKVAAVVVLLAAE